MNPERGSMLPPRASAGAGRSRSRPRVVILDDGDTVQVEVLQLPESTSLGADFSHSGTSWRVTGVRTGDRVLIARPVAS